MRHSVAGIEVISESGAHGKRGWREICTKVGVGQRRISLGGGVQRWEKQKGRIASIRKYHENISQQEVDIANLVTRRDVRDLSC